MKSFLAKYRGHGLVPGETRESIEAETFMEAMQKAEALEHTDECHWTLVLVKRVGATVAIFALLLTPCSTADAGRRCQWKMQRACNRAAIIQQGIPRMRAEAGLNRSRALLNFSKPFNIWG